MEQDNFYGRVKAKICERGMTNVKIINRRAVYENKRKNDPKRIEYRKKYYEENKEELKRKRREYNATEHGKLVNKICSKRWVENNREYDKKRKDEWYQRPGVKEHHNERRRELRRINKEKRKSYKVIVDVNRIIEHLEKACTKHPVFCTSIISGDHSRKKTLELIRMIVEKDPSAQNILGEEVTEIYDAYVEGDKQHAIDECYDAIAVLIRMIKQIESEICQ